MATPQPREDTDPWLVYTLQDHSEKLSTLAKEVKHINGCLRDEISRSRLADSVHDQRLERQKERLEDHKKESHNNPGNSNSKDTVTFKWIADNFSSIATGVITAIIVGALFLWATGQF